MKNPTKGYGPQKSLQEIIEDLGVYCQTVLGKGANFSIILPKLVLEHYHAQFDHKKAIKLNSAANPKARFMASREWISAGVCELFSDDKSEVVSKKGPDYFDPLSVNAHSRPKCKRHPKYQAKREPKADCHECWRIYKELKND